MHPVLVFWQSVRIESTLAQGLQLLGLGKRTSHTLAQGGSRVVWHHTNKSRVNMWLRKQVVCWPGVSTFISLKCNYHTIIISLMPTTYSALTISLGGIQPSREDPSLSLFALSAEPSNLYAPPDWWNGWGSADWEALRSPTQISGRNGH